MGARQPCFGWKMQSLEKVCVLIKKWKVAGTKMVIIPITRDEFRTKEYPNYTRAWITFGLLDAGYAGEKRALSWQRI